MKPKTKESILYIFAIIFYFLLGVWIGYSIGLEDCVKPIEINIEDKLVPSMPPATNFTIQAVNCSATGFVPSTAFNKHYYFCEVSK